MSGKKQVCGNCGVEKRKKSFVPVKVKGTKDGTLREICKNCAKEQPEKFKTSD